MGERNSMERVKDYLETISASLKKALMKAYSGVRTEGGKRYRLVSENALPRLRGMRDDLLSYVVGTYRRYVVRGEYTRQTFLALFIFACVLGAGLKTLALENITIGFEDYTLAPFDTLYDMNDLEKRVVDVNRTASTEDISGETCSEFDN